EETAHSAAAALAHLHDLAHRCARRDELLAERGRLAAEDRSIDEHRSRVGRADAAETLRSAIDEVTSTQTRTTQTDQQVELARQRYAVAIRTASETVAGLDELCLVADQHRIPPDHRDRLVTCRA